jgi:hypothetical protein
VVGCLSEQPPIALGVGSPGETISYPSQHSSDFTRRVHGGRSRGSDCVRRVDFPNVALFPARPVLEPADGHAVESSFFLGGPILLEFLPLLRPRLAIRVALDPVLRLCDVAEYFGVGSSVGETPDEEVPLLVQLVHRQR